MKIQRYGHLINHPPHYAGAYNGIECIDAICAALGQEGFIAFLRGQVIKYQWRLGKKDCSVQDCSKAIWYANKLRDTLEEQQAVDKAVNHLTNSFIHGQVERSGTLSRGIIG